jgi:hypothetical protein
MTKKPTDEQMEAIHGWATWAVAASLAETGPDIEMTSDQAEEAENVLHALVEDRLTGTAKATALKWLHSRTAMWFLAELASDKSHHH